MEKMTLEEIREITDWTNLDNYGADWYNQLGILNDLLNPKFYTHIQDVDSYISTNNMLSVQIAFVAPYKWAFGEIPEEGAREIDYLMSLLQSIDDYRYTRTENIHYSIQGRCGQFAWRVLFNFGVPIKDEYKKKEQ